MKLYKYAMLRGKNRNFN